MNRRELKEKLIDRRLTPELAKAVALRTSQAGKADLTDAQLVNRLT